MASSLQDAKTYTPTAEEWRDPLVYISSIEPEAEQCGIIKVKPPPGWSPPFCLDEARCRFQPRYQDLRDVEGLHRLKVNFVGQLEHYWGLQGIRWQCCRRIKGCPVDQFHLHRAVAGFGGFDKVCQEKKWQDVAIKIGFAEPKHANLLKRLYASNLLPFDKFMASHDSEASDATSGSGRASHNTSLGDVSPTASSTSTTTPAPHQPAAAQQRDSVNAIGGQADNSAAAHINRDSDDSPSAKRPKTEGPAATATTPTATDSTDTPRRARLRTAAVAAAAGKRGVEGGSAEIVLSHGGKRPPLGHEDLTLGDDTCEECKHGDYAELLLLCDKCDKGYHTFCLNPPLTKVPRGDWRCPTCLRSEYKTMEPELLDNYGFYQSPTTYSLKDFSKHADRYEAEVREALPSAGTLDAMETTFWDVVTAKKHINNDLAWVEYGADLPVLEIGSGFPSKHNRHQAKDVDVEAYNTYLKHPWNLINLPLNPRSMPQALHAGISGVSVPWVYAGMLFTSFCWHTEDLHTASINYNHRGAVKTWYGIPAADHDAFVQAAKDYAGDLFDNSPDLLEHLVTLIPPKELLDRGVRVFRLHQHPGEFVITFPKAFHAGFNQGFNVAEAVNFANSAWLPMGRKCHQHYRDIKRRPVFAYPELLAVVAKAMVQRHHAATEASGTTAHASAKENDSGTTSGTTSNGNNKEATAPAANSPIDALDAARVVTELELLIRDEARSLQCVREHLPPPNDDGGVRSVKENPAIAAVPDDDRVCRVCNTTVAAMYVRCACRRPLTCADHLPLHCSCQLADVSVETMCSQATLTDLRNKLHGAVAQFDAWLAQCRPFFSQQEWDAILAGSLRPWKQQHEQQQQQPCKEEPEEQRRHFLCIPSDDAMHVTGDSVCDEHPLSNMLPLNMNVPDTARNRGRPTKHRARRVKQEAGALGTARQNAVRDGKGNNGDVPDITVKKEEEEEEGTPKIEAPSPRLSSHSRGGTQAPTPRTLSSRASTSTSVDADDSSHNDAADETPIAGGGGGDDAFDEDGATSWPRLVPSCEKQLGEAEALLEKAPAMYRLDPVCHALRHKIRATKAAKARCTELVSRATYCLTKHTQRVRRPPKPLSLAEFTAFARQYQRSFRFRGAEQLQQHAAESEAVCHQLQTVLQEHKEGAGAAVNARGAESTPTMLVAEYEEKLLRLPIRPRAIAAAVRALTGTWQWMARCRRLVRLSSNRSDAGDGTMPPRSEAVHGDDEEASHSLSEARRCLEQAGAQLDAVPAAYRACVDLQQVESLKSQLTSLIAETEAWEQHADILMRGKPSIAELQSVAAKQPPLECPQAQHVAELMDEYEHWLERAQRLLMVTAGSQAVRDTGPRPEAEQAGAEGKQPRDPKQADERKPQQQPQQQRPHEEATEPEQEEPITAETIARAKIRPGAQYKDLVRLLEAGQSLPFDMRREVRMIERLMEPTRRWLQSVERAFVHGRGRQQQQQQQQQKSKSQRQQTSRRSLAGRRQGSRRRQQQQQQQQQQHRQQQPQLPAYSLRKVLGHGLAVPDVSSMQTLRSKNEAAENDETALFCLCREDDGGNMVQCACCLDWYHHRCVAYRALPRAARYICPRCAYGRRPNVEALLSLAQSGRATELSTPELNDILRLKDKYVTWLQQVARLWRCPKQQARENVEEATRLAIIGDLMELDTGDIVDALCIRAGLQEPEEGQESEDQQAPATKRAKNTDDENEVFCFCQRPHDDRPMILCDKCEHWYHCGCLALTNAEAEAMSEYRCPSCEEEELQTPPRNGASTKDAGQPSSGQKPSPMTQVLIDEMSRDSFSPHTSPLSERCKARTAATATTVQEVRPGVFLRVDTPPMDTATATGAAAPPSIGPAQTAESVAAAACGTPAVSTPSARAASTMPSSSGVAPSWPGQAGEGAATGDKRASATATGTATAPSTSASSSNTVSPQQKQEQQRKQLDPTVAPRGSSDSSDSGSGREGLAVMPERVQQDKAWVSANQDVLDAVIQAADAH